MLIIKTVIIKVHFIDVLKQYQKQFLTASNYSPWR